jgi:hypothetical protein
MKFFRKCFLCQIGKFPLSFLIVVLFLGILSIQRCKLELNQKPSPVLFRLIQSSGNASGVEIVATPTFNPTAGLYNNAQNISLVTTTTGATIYYTTDGSTPTTSSSVYSSNLGHIWFLIGKTVKVFATKSGFTDSSVLSGIFSYPPLKTGQTICYDTTGTTGNIVACGATKEDGESQTGVARGYTDNGDGTITDNATGLVWQKCYKGRNNDATCSDNGGVTDTSTWSSALTDCSSLSLASKTWRLPSRHELETLPDYSLSNPAINLTFFPATTAAGNYWSSTTDAANAANAWYVGFGGGDVNPLAKTAPNSVRCVTGSSKDLILNFTDNGDFTLKDNSTGLIWQKCFKGRNNDATCSDDGGVSDTSTWSSAITYCSGLTIAGRIWRLPNFNEFKTIVDSTKVTGPTINTIAFPSTASGDYWSSTTTGTTTYAWLVNFSNGSLGGALKTNGTMRVRCVSGP